MPHNQSSALLLAIMAVVGMILLVADAALFIRWVGYLWAKYNLEDRRLREAAAREAATEGTIPPDFALDLSQDPEMPVYPFARTWSLVDPFVAFQVVFIGGQFAILLALLPLLFWNGRIHGEEVIFSAPGILIQCLGLFLLNGLFVGVTAFYLRRYRTSLSAIGLRRPTAQQIALGCGLGLVLFGVATGIETSMGWVLPHLLPKAVVDGLEQFTKDVTAGGMFAKIPSLQLKIFFALAGAAAAPVGEEVFFRGLLYNSLKRRLNIPAAIVISGLLFALVHFGPLAIVVIFPMGMLLAYVYEKTRSLWVTICMHATNNGLAFALALAHVGEAPKEPVKRSAPHIKQAVVCPAHRRLRDSCPLLQPGVHVHG